MVSFVCITISYVHVYDFILLGVHHMLRVCTLCGTCAPGVMMSCGRVLNHHDLIPPTHNYGYINHISHAYDFHSSLVGLGLSTLP